MADDEATTKTEGKPTETVVRDDIAVNLMGNILQKLRVLQYEREMSKKKNFTPYTATQFAVLSFNAGAQFKSFLELVTFLMKKTNQEFIVDKYDDPNTSVNKLLLALKVMGFTLDFPPTKLKLGYGEAVCSALDFICDQALAAQSFMWPRPTYPKEDFADEAEVDVDAEIDGEGELEAVEDEVMYSDSLLASTLPIEKSRTTGEPRAMDLEDSLSQMIVCSVDPILWKTELERVGSKLKVSFKVDDLIERSGGQGTGREWHTHIERGRKHQSAINDVLPLTNAKLKFLGTQLQEFSGFMIQKEKGINLQYETYRQEHETLQANLKKVNDQAKINAEKVNEMTSRYAEITEQLHETKEIMDERGSKMTDTSPLVQIKEALKVLAGEIKMFDLRIGIMGHSLLQVKSRQSTLRNLSNEYNGNMYEDPEFDPSDNDSD